jgi:succinate-semialdehyde dehydrogenase/glutarate-semialdehyde dehydrogenase
VGGDPIGLTQKKGTLALAPDDPALAADGEQSAALLRASVLSVCHLRSAANRDRMALVSINPSTGRRIAIYREFSRAAIEQALARADAAQRRWRELTPQARAKYLLAVKRELLARREALAALATAEMGKPISQARAEIEKCATLCDYYAQNAEDLFAECRPAGASANARVVFEPLGVVLAIMPWNFPFWQVLRATIPTLVAGNALLLKHAPNVSGCALAVEKVFTRAGFPTGVFQVLLTGTNAVPGLIADPRVRGVTLTGSTAAGKSVAALAGAAMKPGVFELGGSDPAIVLEDADVDRAAEICAHARLLNTGQSCVCAKRFIVHRAIRREFEEKFAARIAARRIGDPTDPATEIGPLARSDLRDKLHEQVRRSVQRGARILLGGNPLAGRGFYYAPTVLTHVQPGMPAHDEELFGPVAAVIPARNDAEAVRIANTSTFGLGAAVFTRDGKRAERIARDLESGCVFVNDFVRSSPELPFGGVKESGFGRELGEWGAHAFVNVKTIVTSQAG